MTNTKDINRYAVPIIFYDPKGKYVGENMDLAQQMIYINHPTNDWL